MGQPLIELRSLEWKKKYVGKFVISIAMCLARNQHLFHRSSDLLLNLLTREALLFTQEASPVCCVTTGNSQAYFHCGHTETSRSGS
jgi:hypothetical protein